MASGGVNRWRFVSHCTPVVTNVHQLSSSFISGLTVVQRVQLTECCLWWRPPWWGGWWLYIGAAWADGCIPPYCTQGHSR